MGASDRSLLRSTSAHVLVDPDLLGAGGRHARSTTTSEHHLRRVLRLRDGDVVSVTDGDGRWCLAAVMIDATGMRLDATSQVVVEPTPARPITHCGGDAERRPARLDGAEGHRARRRSPRAAARRAFGGAVEAGSGRAPARPAAAHRRRGAPSESAGACAWRSMRRLPPSDVLGDFVVAEPGGRSLAHGDTPWRSDPKVDGVDVGARRLPRTASISARRSCARRPLPWRYPHSAWHSNADRLCCAELPPGNVPGDRQAGATERTNRTARRELT